MQKVYLQLDKRFDCFKQRLQYVVLFTINLVYYAHNDHKQFFNYIYVCFNFLVESFSSYNMI